MYEKIMMELNPALTRIEAAEAVQWMRDNIYPTLDHLTRQAFKDSLIEFLKEKGSKLVK